MDLKTGLLHETGGDDTLKGREQTVDEPTMEDMRYLWEEDALDYKKLQRGDIVEGTIMRIDRDGVLVDIGSKSEGIIPPHELQSLTAKGLSELKLGDPVVVYVMQAENQEGQVVLSLDRARGEKGWRTLQHYFETGDSLDAPVVDYNKGGLIVAVEGVRGFVPTSQIASMSLETGTNGQVENRLAQMVGKELRLKVIEINRRRNRLILSERAALQEWRSQQRERLLLELHEGEIRRGRITSIRNFGVFIDLGGADGLAHLSELSWDRVRDPEEFLKVGDEVDVYVMKVDSESKKIALSLRRAQPEQWEEIIDKYEVGQLVTGTITKLAAFGAFARIEGPVEGLIHVSELADHRIVHPKEVVKEGDTLTLKILRIERDRHRLGLSLKQAQEETGEYDRNDNSEKEPED